MDDSQRKCIETELRDSESKDRITSLPDDVLGRILSFLPTKYAVTTSVLSSRWKDLYKLSTTFDFDESTHLIKCEANFKRRGRRWKGADTFRGFVNKILPEYKSNISKFRLICEKPLYNFVDLISAYKIAEFELSILAHQISYTLKLNKLKCENLVVLKLDGPMDVKVRKSVTFPVLKVLFLIGVRIHAYAEPSSVNQGLNEILKGCPLLEELVIKGCDWNAGECKLACQCVEGLTNWKFELPTFCNLIRLHLSIGSKVNWDQVLWDFLDSSPCLESLTLEQEDGKDFQRWQSSRPNEVVPCVKSHLKFINIIGFNGFKEEIEMIYYFLINANVLEKMVVHWDNGGRRLIEEVALQMPKSSKSCVIAFK